jgi:prevent-host-death family protein
MTYGRCLAVFDLNLTYRIGAKDRTALSRAALRRKSCTVNPSYLGSYFLPGTSIIRPSPAAVQALIHSLILTGYGNELYSWYSWNRGFMNDGIIVSALEARANFGKLLRRVEDEGRSLVIEKRGRPRAVLLSIRDYVRLAVPEPEVLRVLGKESKQRGTNRLSSRQIDRVIQATRSSKRR